MVSCSKDEETSKATPIIKAADMSYLPLIESEGTIFYNENNLAEDALLTLKRAGCNTIRIRLWHTPSDNHSGFNEVKNFLHLPCEDENLIQEFITKTTELDKFRNQSFGDVSGEWGQMIMEYNNE